MQLQGRAPRAPQPQERARVALGGRPPRAPTDPDVRNSRIRLFVTRVHCAGA